MPRYLVQDPDSGRSMLLEGDSAPTEQELSEIFKAYSTTPDAAPAPAQEPAPATTEEPAAKPEPEKPSPAPLATNPEMQAKLGLRPIDISQKGPRKSYAENALTPEERQEAVRRETWGELGFADRVAESVARGAQTVGKQIGGAVRGIGTIIDASSESALAQEGFLDEAAQLRNRTGEQKVADREKMPLVQAGRAIDTATAKAFPYEKPEKATDIAGATLEAVGGAIPTVAAAPIAGAGGALLAGRAGFAAMSMLGAMTAGTVIEFDDAYEREIEGQKANQETLDPERAFRSAAKYAGITVPIEFGFGVGRILRGIKKYFGPEAASEAGKRALRGVPALAEFARDRMKDSGAGFIQEFTESIAQDLLIEGLPDLAQAWKEGVMGAVGQSAIGGAAHGVSIAANKIGERLDLREGEKEADRKLAYREQVARMGGDPIVQNVAPLTAAVLTDQAQVTPPNVGTETPVDQPETTEQRLTREAQPAIESFNAAKQAEAQQPTQPEGGVDQSEEEGQKEGVQVTPTQPEATKQQIRESLVPQIEEQLKTTRQESGPNRGTFGIDTDASVAVAPLFDHFDLPEGVRQDGWMRTKWGSWYNTIAYTDAKGETHRWKISIRDHAPTRTDLGIPEYYYEVGKDWNPKSVANALTKTEQRLQERIAQIENPAIQDERTASMVALQKYDEQIKELERNAEKRRQQGALDRASRIEKQIETIRNSIGYQRALKAVAPAQSQPTQNVPPTTDTNATQEPVAATVQPNATEQAGSQTQETQAQTLATLSPEEAIKRGAAYGEYKISLEPAFRDGTITEQEFSERYQAEYDKWPKYKIGHDVFVQSQYRGPAKVTDVGYGWIEVQLPDGRTARQSNDTLEDLEKWNKRHPEHAVKPVQTAQAKGEVKKEPWQMTRAEYGVPDEPQDVTVERYKNTERLAKERPNDLTDADKALLERTKQQKAQHSKYLKQHKAYVAKSNEHLHAVEQAIAQGKPVPAEVLAEYPYLTSTPNVPPTVTPERVPTTSGEPATQTTAQKETETKEEVADSRAVADAEKRMDNLRYTRDAQVADSPKWKKLDAQYQAAYRRWKQLASPESQPSQPTGMGGAVKDEFGPKAKFTAEMRAEAIDADRAKRGQPPLVKAMRESDESVWQQAMAMIDNDWNAPAELLRSIQQTPRVLTPVEMMLMLYYKVDLKNTFDKLDREMQQAQADGRAEAAESAREEMDRRLKTLDEVEKAVGVGDSGAATMAGRALRAYRLVMNEDFSLAELSRRFEAAAGRKATDEEMAELRKRAADWERTANEYDALLKAYEQNARDEALKTAFERTQNEAKQRQQPRYSKRVLEMAESFAKRCGQRADKAWAEIEAMMKGEDPNQPMLSGPINPELLDKLIIYTANRVAQVGIDFAVWTEEMVAKLGERFRQHAQAIWDAAQKRITQDDFDKEMGGDKYTRHQAKKAAKERKHLSPDEQVEQILKNLGKKKLDEIQNSRERMDKIRNTTRRLARLFVEQGVTSRDELVDRLFETLSPVVPDLTREETRDAFSGYGVYYPPSKETVDVILRDLRTQLQQIGKLEDMARGQAPQKTGAGRAEMSDEARRLVKQVEEAKKKGGYAVTDPERQLRTALQAVQRRLENQIADLEKEIADRKKIVREPRKLEYDEKTLKLKARRDELKAIHDQVFAKPEMTEAERLEKWKQNIRRRIDDYTQKLADHDVSQRQRPPDPRLDSEARKLRFEMQKIHRAVLEMRLKAELAKRNLFSKMVGGVANTIRFSRAVMTGGEFSAVLRQGGIWALSHPMLSSQSIAPMFRAFRSEQGQFDVLEDIQTRPNSPLYQKFKLDFTEAGVRLSTMEEHIMFRMSDRLKKIPGMNWVVNKVEDFQRAYTTYLNHLRANAFDMMAETYGYDDKTLEAIANYINVTTGRGSTGLGRWVGPSANTVFFAPRYTISRFQFLAAQPIYHAKGLSNKGMIAKEYMRVLGGAGTILGLALLAGLDLEDDPRSPDFGKIIVGNTRIDFLAGLVQALRFAAVFSTGWRKQDGKLIPIRKIHRLPKDWFGGPDRAKVEYGKDTFWVIMKFLRTKLSPVFGGGLSWLVGSDPNNEPFGTKELIAQSFTPITWADVIDIAQKDGIPKATIVGLGALFGLGTQDYDEHRRRQRPER